MRNENTLENFVLPRSTQTPPKKHALVSLHKFVRKYEKGQYPVDIIRWLRITTLKFIVRGGSIGLISKIV